MKDEKAISRRDFIQRISFIGVAGVGAGTLLSACGGGGGQQGGGEMAGEFTCTDTAGLTEQEVQMRQTLQYVDQSPFPDKLCNNCALWQDPAEGQQCGGCTVVKGPIHPKGHCTSWAAKPETAT